MQIVTDTGMDMYLPGDLMPDLPIHVVPHVITLDGVSYKSGIDIQPSELQEKLLKTNSFPVTSQPAAGDFATTFQKLITNGDRDILCINMSSGLSGTINSALAGAKMVPEANITIVDTKTLCAVQGWQVAAAARAIKAGWPLADVLSLIKKIGDQSESVYTLDDLKYLIHGGRISHMKGLIASVLKIRPIIGVEKINGTYSQLGMARTFDQAVKSLVVIMRKFHDQGSRLRVQVLHSYNEKAAELLRQYIEPEFDCQFLPVNYMSPALAAHTGPSMVGVAFAPQNIFADLP